jgi:hypothetical protein
MEAMDSVETAREDQPSPEEFCDYDETEVPVVYTMTK